MVEQQVGTYEEWTNEDGSKEAKITPPPSPEQVEAEQAEEEWRELRGKILTLAEIEAAEDVREQIVPVPEWGGSVKIRQFTKDKEFMIRKAARIGGQVDSERLEMLLLIGGIVEPEVNEETIGLFQQKSMPAVDRILKQIEAINAVTKKEADKATKTFPR